MLLSRAIALLVFMAAAAFTAWRIPAPRGPFFTRYLALILLAIGVELIGLLTSQLGIRNAIMYNLYVMIEFSIMLSLVRLIRPRWRTVLWLVGVLGICAMVVALSRVGATRELALEGILVIGFLSSAVYLWLLVHLAGDSQERLDRTPSFWIFIGALVYFGGMIPIIGTWRYIGDLDIELSKALYWIVIVLAIIRYSCSIVACTIEHKLANSTK